MRLIFKSEDVMRCVNHALKSENWSMGYESDLKPSPGLSLVHDDGVYLMSNGVPGDIQEYKDRCHVVYAKDCNPELDEFFYENSRNLVGGDDFVENILIDESWPEKLSGFDEIHIVLTEEDLAVYFVNNNLSKTG